MFEAKFQTFDDTADPGASAPRVIALRTELARRGLTGFIVPHADCHQSEYLPASEERLAWLTGFTGSAGVAIVLIERATLFVDGRYTLQAREQVDTFDLHHRASGRDAAGPVDRAHARQGRRARLRSMAAHGRGRGEARQGLRECRCHARRDRAQSDRRIVERPPCPTARRGEAARPSLRGRSRRRQSSR